MSYFGFVIKSGTAMERLAEYLVALWWCKDFL